MGERVLRRDRAHGFGVARGADALRQRLVMPGSVVSAGAATIARPAGAGPPVAASGMGTQAALDNPRCRHDDPTYGPYGRFDTTSVGGGPACVKVWKEGADNGGATSQGVTKDRVKVVFVLPNEEQFKSDPVKPINRASNTTGTYQDGLYDYLIPELRFYETWGRDLEAHFYTSSGSDEQSQRSDIVAIKAMKPFAVMNLISGQNLKVLETGLAAAKILTQGYSASYADSAKQSPYLWGSADNNATAINSAEVLGKQLVGKKAEFGGDDVAGQTRKIGVVSDGSIDDALFVDAFREFGGKVTTTATVPIDSDAIAVCGAADHHAAEERGCHDHRDVRRRRWRAGAHGDREQAGLLPGVVLHRRVLPGHRDPGPQLPARTGAARVRDLLHQPVDEAGSGDRSQDRRGHLVLGSGRPAPTARATSSRSRGC